MLKDRFGPFADVYQGGLSVAITPAERFNACVASIG
jgi:hypothetical protein